MPPLMPSLAVVVAPVLAAIAPSSEPPPAVSAADTVWMLVATALVLLMTPALGFFYGGMVRAKNALNTLMMSFAALGVVGLVWVALGYSLAFAPGSAIVGGLDFALLRGVGLEAKGTIPHLLFMAYQGTFAIITAALISGAVVERMRFVPFVAFMALWTLAVYAPLAHWVWGGGWLGALGVLDYAGGTVVHVNAGVAAAVAATVVGGRRAYGRQALLPHNVPFVVLGAALLYVGWFGFNAGSALGASPAAALAFVNTLLAPMGALVVWLAIDLARTGRVTAVGLATGLVVGLVAITPAAGFVGPMAAIVLGACAAVPSYFAILLRPRTRLDDSLDVLSAHGVGGITGALLTGVLARAAWGGTDGLLAGHPRQLLLQLVGVAAAALYSGVATLAVLKLVALALPLRASAREEGSGMDLAEHGEEAYGDGDGTILVLPEHVPAPGTAAALAPRAAMEGAA